MYAPSEPRFYLGEGEFTRFDDYIKYAASEITGEDVIEEIHKFVKSIPQPKLKRKKMDYLWRTRTAGQIIQDDFSTGCTDDSLVFLTLARIKGIPSAYVETIEENFLKNPLGNISGHIFVDVYQSGKWIPYNPRHGKTIKDREVYLFLPEKRNRRYLELARGLDFSQLYTNAHHIPVELKSKRQIRELVKSLYS
jgi:hypothetical protein